MPSTSPPVDPPLRRRRATALPADARRAMIVDAALPLIVAHGEAVTTQQIATAAGIAEGTMFRVFAGKDELIDAVLAKVLDPAAIDEAIAALATDTGLEAAVVAVVRLVQRRVAEIWQLMTAVGPRFHDHRRRPTFASPALVALLGAHADELTVDPDQAALMLRSTTLALTHPMMTPEPFSPESIARHFLHGVSKPVLTRLLKDKLRPYRRTIGIMVILQIVQTAATLTLPTLNARIIDNGVLKHDQAYIGTTGAEMLGLSLVQIVFAIAAVYLGARVAMGFGRDVRDTLFHSVTAFSAREVGSYGAPSLITRITNDVQQVQMLVVMAATMAIAAPITLVIGVFAALHQDVGLSLVIVVSVPGAAIILGIIVSRMVPAFRLMQVRIDQINRVLREQITGIRVVRAFVREPQEQDRFATANAALTDTSLRAGRLMSSMFPTVNLIINVSSVAVLWFGASRIQAGTMQVGSLVAYLTYLIQILMSVVMATFMMSMIPRASVSAQRIQEVLDTSPSVVAPGRPEAVPAGRADIEFRHVGFSYPGADHPVLNDVSFVTAPGQTTAIVGSTGAGKTTLLSLIPRLFDATAGSVMIGGVDVRRLDTAYLWSTIGLVPQRPYLFSGTVASNLAYGRADATEAQMWEALEVAQAADFVRQMPGALDARIDQGGTNVSGGQRQRLAIARALVRQPDIYLFDDSFSALDLTTDARLRAALKPYTAHSAVLIVAQRVSTITSADRIIVLEDGEVVGMGADAELRDTCPTYAEIVQSQLGEKVA